MSIFYIIAEKIKLGGKSGNLPSSKYGEFEANSPHFTQLCGNPSRFSLYRNKPEISSDQILIKVEANDYDINHSSMKGYRGRDSINISTRQGAGSYFKINVISQIMGDDVERTKENALKEEMSPKKTQKDHTALRAFTYIAQKVIDVKERNIGKNEPPKSSKRI